MYAPVTTSHQHRHSSPPPFPCNPSPPSTIPCSPRQALTLRTTISITPSPGPPSLCYRHTSRNHQPTPQIAQAFLH